MKIGQQHVDDFEPITGRYEQIGFPDEGMNAAIAVRGGFQSAKRGAAVDRTTAFRDGRN